MSFVLLFAGYLYVTREKLPFGVKLEGQGDFYKGKIISVEEPVITDIGYNTVTTYNFTVELKSGPHKGEEAAAYQTISTDTPVNMRPVSEGDKVVLYENVNNGITELIFAEYVRSDALIVLAVLFAVFLVGFGGIKGLKTLVTLTLTLGAVFFVLIPAILNGYNIYIYTILVCIYITAMTLAIVNGITHMSLVGGIGCIGGVLVSAVLMQVTDHFIKLTGFRDEGDIYLLYINDSPIDLKALVFAGILIGSIGAVMDVAVNISASLHEVACKIEKPTFRELYRSGITISRDIIGTMSNTLILAYIGSSLCSVLLTLYNNSFSPLAMFNKESFVCEILTILIGSFGILVCLPLTSAVSALFYSKWDKSVRLAGSETPPPEDDETDEYVKLLESADKDENE